MKEDKSKGVCLKYLGIIREKIALYEVMDLFFQVAEMDFHRTRSIVVGVDKNVLTTR